MSEGFMGEAETLAEEARYPWLEDLTYYAIKYNERATLDNIMRIAQKAADNGEIDTALNVLRLAISNCQSPPHYIYPHPLDARVVYIKILEASHFDLRKADAKEDWVVIIGFQESFAERGQARISYTCLRIWYNTKVKKWITEFMSVNRTVEVLKRLQQLSQQIQVKHAAHAEEGAGEPEAEGEADEGEEIAY